jgi:hypothetical protein
LALQTKRPPHVREVLANNVAAHLVAELEKSGISHAPTFGRAWTSRRSGLRGLRVLGPVQPRRATLGQITERSVAVEA